MHTKLRTVLFSVLLTTLPTANAAWTDFFGAHYSSTTWENTIRDHKYGLEMNGTAIPMLTSRQITEIQDKLVDSDGVFIIGGLGSMRDQNSVNAYMNTMQTDAGQQWRDAVTAHATTLAALQGTKKIYLQIGNEINSAKAAETLHGWAKDGMKGVGNDVSTLPMYVEYYLAPSVSGINKANATALNPINIMLGSVSNFGNPDAAVYLDALLNYKIAGTYAPDLAGKYVYELIDIASIHYLVGTENRDWKTILDTFKTTWVGKGRVKGIWSTEEGGAKAADDGRGGASALRMFSRYMSWWQDNGILSDKGRAIIWGSERGPSTTRGADAMQAILDFAGSADLRKINGAVTPDADFEVYTFDVKGTRNRMITILPGSDFSLSKITVAGRITTGVTPTAHVFSADGHEEITLMSSKEGRKSVLTFPAALNMSTAKAVLITYSR